MTADQLDAAAMGGRDISRSELIETLVAVAAPQVAWLSGVLAAAEIAKDAAGLPPLDRRLDVDLRGLPLGSIGKRTQDQSGRCACASPHRIGWMRRLYPTVGST